MTRSSQLWLIFWSSTNTCWKNKLYCHTNVLIACNSKERNIFSGIQNQIAWKDSGWATCSSVPWTNLSGRRAGAPWLVRPGSRIRACSSQQAYWHWLSHLNHLQWGRGTSPVKQETGQKTTPTFYHYGNFTIFRGETDMLANYYHMMKWSASILGAQRSIYSTKHVHIHNISRSLRGQPLRRRYFHLHVTESSLPSVTGLLSPFWSKALSAQLPWPGHISLCFLSTSKHLSSIPFLSKIVLKEKRLQASFPWSHDSHGTDHCTKHPPRETPPQIVNTHSLI